MKARTRISISEVIPGDITLVENSTLGLGLDVATTDKGTSNPSSLALVEKVRMDYVVRLLLRWKTADPDVARAIIMSVLMKIAPRRVRKFCIDATNEKYFATDLKKHLGALVPTELIVSSEKMKYLGEEMLFKVYLGNLLINTMEDGHLAICDETWVKDDFRLVKRDRGSFTAEPDSAGNHADTFDAVKLGLHGVMGVGGPAEGNAAQVGQFGAQSAQGQWKNPFASLFNKDGRKLNV